MPSENSGGDGKGVVDYAAVAISTMDGDSLNAGQGAVPDTNITECPAPAINSRGTPHPETHKTDGMSLIQQQLRSRGISTAGTDIIMASWRPATAKQYQPHVSRWLQFCNMRHIDPITPTVTDIVNFLSDSFHRSVGYESVNTARGALSLLEIVVGGCRAENFPLVNRFLRGVFNLRPSTLRYLGRSTSPTPAAEHGSTMLAFSQGSHSQACDVNGSHTSCQDPNITFHTVEGHNHYEGLYYLQSVHKEQ